jgi:hypothetical protein
MSNGTINLSTHLKGLTAMKSRIIAILGAGLLALSAFIMPVTGICGRRGLLNCP